MMTTSTDNTCPECGANTFYTLADDRLMCRQCKKKFTATIKPFRIDPMTQKKILSFFMENISAESTAKELGINRKTIQKYYRYIRKAIAQDSERIENLYFGTDQETSKAHSSSKFCVLVIKNRVLIVPHAKVSEDINDNFEFYPYYYIECAKENKSLSLSILLRKGPGEESPIALKFKNYLIKLLAEVKSSNVNNFYFQLKEIEYKYNKSNDLDDLFNLESIIH